ncbi:hypothetical protein TGAMA5MH_00332 [Trichoderma gamsii]|uniref:Heterokaryon incompatibility domain-containing protein n=1 Tax=Trichoderma gamsii TaxID=398673 RepID=A0A2K0TT22_9HYPO|nr:hypothetical protein TGAMA5MH_00332 [Trichoderma gamsii]
MTGGFRRIRTEFNTEYLHGMRTSHEDLSDLLPDIEAVERLIRSEAQDDNGRGAGSIIALLRDPTGIVLYMCLSTWMKTISNTWIRRCEEEHSQCAYFRRSEPWFPTRVIDVGSLGNLSVILVPGGRAIAKNERYMTLSHRWGSSNVPTLTTKTIDTWKSGLSVNILPKRYQDFIALAQRLQIRYVWIDSLCIIQGGDGGKDWRAEALTMDQVYQNSFCNVSADWGSGRRGLYFERDLRLLDKPHIDWKVRREPNRDVVVVEKCILVENEFWEEQVTRSPLSVRGWVVQERWLSPRNLRFGSREVFFECAESTVCERFPDKFPEVLREGDVIFKATFSKLQMTPSRQTALEPATPGTELYDAWGDVLAKYSRCNLTFASDRAVAFAGIAKFFRALVDDNYVVGLWLRNLASEMMWYRHRLRTKAVIEEPRDRLSLFQQDQAHQYRAPSFSWASTAVPIAPNHAKGNSGFLAAVKCVKYRDTQNALVEEWTDDLYICNPTPAWATFEKV